MNDSHFKTNMRCPGCVEKAGPALDALAGAGRWKVDLADPDRVLSVHETTVPASRIVKALKKAGFSAELKNR